MPFLLDNQNFGFMTVFIMDYEMYVFRAVGLASTGIFILKTFVCQILPFLKLLDTLYDKLGQSAYEIFGTPTWTHRQIY